MIEINTYNLIKDNSNNNRYSHDNCNRDWDEVLNIIDIVDLYISYIRTSIIIKKCCNKCCKRKKRCHR